MTVGRGGLFKRLRLTLDPPHCLAVSPRGVWNRKSGVPTSVFINTAQTGGRIYMAYRSIRVRLTTLCPHRSTHLMTAASLDEPIMSL